MQSRFIQPLGLRRTTWVVPDHDDWARPYRKVGAGHAPELLAGDGALAPLGGIWSCVEDVTRWSQWLADAHPARHGADDGPLRRASRREMQQLHRFSENEKLAGRAAPTGYGYGLTRREDPALGPLVGHSGGLPGYGSNMRWAPGRGVVVVAMANVTYPPMAELTLRIFDELHRAGAVPPVTVALDPDLDRLARSLVDLLQDWDDGRADALFADNVALDEPYDRRRAKAVDADRVGGADDDHRDHRHLGRRRRRDAARCHRCHPEAGGRAGAARSRSDRVVLADPAPEVEAVTSPTTTGGRPRDVANVRPRR